jgi:hypothetical protein
MRRLLLLLAVAACMAAPAMADYTPGSMSGWYRYGNIYATGSSGWVGGDGLDPGTDGSPYENVVWSVYTLDVGKATKFNSQGQATAWQDTGLNIAPVSCIDLVQVATTAWKYYDDVDLTSAPIGSGNQVMTPEQASRLRELWTEHGGLLLTSNTQRAAFQLAVWEIVYQRDVVPDETSGLLTGYDVRSGWDQVNHTGFEAVSVNGTTKIASALPANNAAANLANDWLVHLNGVNDMAGRWYGTDQFMNVRALVSEDTQDWAFYNVDAGMIPVPGAALLGLLGFSLIGWVKRRFA